MAAKVYSGNLFVGVVADRPTLRLDTLYGARFLATDEDKLYWCDGDEWQEVFGPESSLVDTDQIAADAITGAKIEDDAVDSEHIAAGAIDNEHLADDAVDSDELAAGAVDRTHLSGGFNKLVKVAGQDETMDTTIDVTGIAVGDELIAVFVEDGTDALWTARALTDFTIGAGILTVGANAADNTSNAYIIFWNDLT